MAFPEMKEFFVDLDSLKDLPSANSDIATSRHTFPYNRQMEADMDIRYNHGGTLAWSAPKGMNLRVLFLIVRIPEKSKVSNWYQVWAFEDGNIQNLFSVAGKISSGNMKDALGIPKDEKGFELASKDIQSHGGIFFEGSHEAVCNWIYTFAQGKKKTKAGVQS